MVHISPERKRISQPLIFLAGPIQGAADWQGRAIKLLADEAPDLDVASPRRPIVSLGEFSKEQYHEQVDWEHEHLAAADKNGVILFWLAAQDHVVEGRSYAQTTRFELGEYVARHVLSGTRVVVGIEPGFTNAKYIRHTIGKKAPGIPVCETLEETCLRAVTLARGAA